MKMTKQFQLKIFNFAAATKFLHLCIVLHVFVISYVRRYVCVGSVIDDTQGDRTNRMSQIIKNKSEMYI